MRPKKTNSTNLHHNQALSRFRGAEIKQIAFVQYDGDFPEIGRYTGPMLLCSVKSASGHDLELLLLPKGDQLEFLIVSCGSDSPMQMSQKDMVLEACDYLEAECLANGNSLSRFRGKESTVYVALTDHTRAVFDRLYEQERPQ